MEKADPSSIVNDVEELSTPLRGSQHQDDDGNKLVAVITRALNSQPADAMADIIRTHCPNVFLALKSAIAAEVRTACQKLCRLSQRSVLYGNRYESVKEFTFDSIWNEMERNIPFMIQIMSAVSAKNSANISADLSLSQLRRYILCNNNNSLKNKQQQLAQQKCSFDNYFSASGGSTRSPLATARTGLPASFW